MRKIDREDKILSISHLDADGIASQIVLGNVFKNIKYFTYQFVKIDESLNKIDFSPYDHVFVTDIYPSVHKLMDLTDKFILLDHHETALPLHNPAKMRFVDLNQCGASLTKSFIEHYFKIRLEHLDRFIYLINDYDLWIHADPFSKKFNLLYGMYRGINKDMSYYRKRFMYGNVALSEEELLYIEGKEREYKIVFDDIEMMEFEHIKGGLVLNVNKFVNEICSDLMEHNGYRIVFLRNPDTGHTNVRHNIPGLNIGKLLEEHDLGGGHKNAAGMKILNPDVFTKSIMVIEKFLYKNFPEVRKDF